MNSADDRPGHANAPGTVASAPGSDESAPGSEPAGSDPDRPAAARTLAAPAASAAPSSSATSSPLAAGSSPGTGSPPTDEAPAAVGEPEPGDAPVAATPSAGRGIRAGTLQRRSGPRHARDGDAPTSGDRTPAPVLPAEPGRASRPAEHAAGLVMAAVTPGVVFRWAVAATLGVFAVILLSSALYAVRDILVLVVIAMFIAVSLDPAVRWMIRHGVRRSWAVGLIVLLMLVIFAGFVLSVAPPLVGQAGRLAADLPGYVRELPQRSNTLRDLYERFNLGDRLSGFASELPARIGGSAIGFVRRFLGALLSTLIVIVLTIYFMADLPRLRRGLVRLFPRAHRPRVAEVVNVVVDKVGGYMIGNLIISVFAGVSAFIVLAALRVPYALPLAFAVAIADLIPLIGATLGAAICVLVAVISTDIWPTAVIVLLFFVVYQQVENYLIAPRVLRNTVDLSSVAVLLAALIGGSVMGVPGALMAIPVVAAIKVLLSPTIAALNEPPPAESGTPSASPTSGPPSPVAISGSAPPADPD
jgi:predicted PurR-regulated permease PerM